MFSTIKAFPIKMLQTYRNHLFSFYLLQDKNIHARRFSLAKNIEKFYLHPLKKFIYDDVNYFDQYLKISLGFIYQYLCNFYLNNKKQIKLRQRLGFIVDGHGKLKTEYITISENGMEFFSRLSRQIPPESGMFFMN